MATMHSLTESADFVRPDYAGGGLLNLMATLSAAGGAASPYAPLAAEFGLDACRLAATRKIVLIVIDGLGDVLLDATVAPTLAAHRVGRITSVFPSTTASAVTTLLTGLAPAQHGLTGWHMWFEEIAQILSVLPLVPRGPRAADWDSRRLPERLFRHQALSARMTRRHLTLSPVDILESPFNAFHTKASIAYGYRSPAEFFPALANCLATRSGDAAYVHAYLPDLDELMHKVGPGDPSVNVLLAHIDRAFAAFLERIADDRTTVIVTADHGFIRAPNEHQIELERHPALAAMLARPLCGESRVAFAYVRRECGKEFEAYVGEHFAEAIQLFRTGDFIRDGWFGPRGPALPEHPQLHSRAGDYVLLMRGDWTIKDWLPGEKRYRQRGVHAGASAAEMWVPLIVARP